MEYQDFLARRQQGIGGSDIAAIIGLSNWRTPRDIYLDKKGLSEPQDESDAMYWGHALEDVVAQEYAKRTGYKVEKCNHLFVHPEYPFLIGNIDRGVVVKGKRNAIIRGKLKSNRILECKTASVYASHEWGESGTQVIPECYKAQVQWYMGLTGAEYCDVAVLIGGRDFRMYEFKRDERIIEYLFAEGVKFWREFVEQDIMPPAVSIDDVERVCHGIEKAKRYATPSITDLVVKYRDVDQSIKMLEQVQAELKLKICEFIGDAEELMDGKTKLATWSSMKPSVKIDYKAIVEELKPDAQTIAKHTTITTGSRRFSVKK